MSGQDILVAALEVWTPLMEMSLVTIISFTEQNWQCYDSSTQYIYILLINEDLSK